MNKKPVEVNINELVDLLDRYFDADSSINYAFKIVGHPGVGKSAIVKEVAEKKNFYFIDTRLAFKENIDLGGYPVPDHENRRMIYYRPKFIPPEKVPENYDGIVWFLDESNRAHPTVIQTLFQIITERTCGEHSLPPKTSIVLAGNLGDMDNTTITEFDDSALDGRLAIFHLKPSAEDWLKWASETGVHPSVIKYISLYPERLWNEEKINPNPRGWHQASQAMKLSYNISSEKELADYLEDNYNSPLEKLITSLLGNITGSDFINQQTAPRELSTAEILEGNKNKLKALKAGEIPSEDILWAISGSINHLREKNIIIKNNFGNEDMRELANVLKFIGYSRADTRMSFFYMLMKECGIFTQIPAALKTIEEDEIKQELTDKFTEMLEV